VLIENTDHETVALIPQVSLRMAKLYDRTADRVGLDEIERNVI
jgi:hypothetical protein